MRRVADLMDGWARALGLAEEERIRWRAAAHLHDALRDAPPVELLGLVPEGLRGLPGALLHGPAAATRLRTEGVHDEALLEAIAYHTIGAGGLGRLGRALYAADFLDPGRSFRAEWRRDLQARMPRDFDEVLIEIARARIENLLAREAAILPETTAFWNTLVAERG
jgi:2-amino-4-hydroxy-6-hydroxymethyldihydropteridine diphosphokinase